MNLVTIFQILAFVSGAGLVITVIAQWKNLVKKN